MNQFPSWQFDEMKQIGKDYADLTEVEAFDAFHSKFRNVEKENEAIIKTLSLQEDHTIIEFGTGTGAFAIQAAACARQIYAVDVSRAMLDYASRKAEKKGLTNILFCHGGFLSYRHAAAPVDCIVTSFALHHLPDFWKGVALRRLNAILKPEGRLFLYDVVYSGENDEANIKAWISNQESAGGQEAVEDVEMHIREEYSTLTWIMESLLERAGFRIDSVKYDQGVLAQYVCTKMADGAKFISSQGEQ
ncbi:MAG: class I SAM-dependent methyltransferase [Nitrospiria bacterium]